MGTSTLTCQLPGPPLPTVPYQTPPGKMDLPYCYIFDSSTAGLTNGLNYPALGVQLHQDSDFILRHIAGIPQCVAAAPNGRYNLYNPDGSYANGGANRGLVPINNTPVLPEKLYRDHLFFDLFAFLNQAFQQGGNSISQIGFFGVKRFSAGPRAVRVTPYSYTLTPYTWVFNLSIGPRAASPTTLFQPIDQWDFELWRITISVGTNPGPAGTGALLTQDFAITLYEPTLDKQLSNLPIPQSFINAARTTPAIAPPYQGCWPVPPVVYPGNGGVKFDIQSNWSPGAPNLWTYVIGFEGAKRIPK